MRRRHFLQAATLAPFVLSLFHRSARASRQLANPRLSYHSADWIIKTGTCAVIAHLTLEQMNELCIKSDEIRAASRRDHCFEMTFQNAESGGGIICTFGAPWPNVSSDCLTEAPKARLCCERTCFALDVLGPILRDNDYVELRLAWDAGGPRRGEKWEIRTNELARLIRSKERIPLAA